MIHSRACALLLACAAAIAHAQQTAGAPVNGGPAPGFVEESWTTRDGLPVNSISMIVQSRAGYIWLATFDGLV
ncbi:MAG TPA: hypothetical protein VGQ30_05690, partial [Gemmatimonadaceae bacterium]|nr:hypothetical protein [Gemmatimonadaceae bacterium]